MEHLVAFSFALVLQQKKSLTKQDGQLHDLKETVLARNRTKVFLCQKLQELEGVQLVASK